MINFQIKFLIPWLLLLIIPALVLTFLPYFRLQKRYRRTRNRIISMVLHLCIMVMCISVLAGMTFAYDIPHMNNEVILVVDASYSNSDMKEAKDNFVEEVVRESNGLFKVGIVTFGYDQSYVVKLSNDVESVVSQYKRASSSASVGSTKVDTSATDIGSALEFAASQFTKYENAKIVLIADGIQTDGDALEAVRTLVNEKQIKVDTRCFPNPKHRDYQIIGATVPDYNVGLGDSVDVTVSVQSSIGTQARVTVTDLFSGGEESVSQNIALTEGIQNTILSISFDAEGLHELRVSIEEPGIAEGVVSEDHTSENNTYYSYIYINVYKRILLLEGVNGDGAEMEKILKSAKSTYGGPADFEVTRVYVGDIKSDPTLVPEDVDSLRAQYDQVILDNISNEDLTWNITETNEDGTQGTNSKYYAEILKDYTNTYGGGVFMIGGNEKTGTDKQNNPLPHAFDRADYDSYKEQGKTDLADMLPVRVVPYRPPIGLMIIMDISNSMNQGAGTTGTPRLGIAQDAAIKCVEALEYYDYVGVTTLSGSYDIQIDMMSMVDEETIKTAIKNLDAMSDTRYAPAITAAGEKLAAFDQVEVRHIILLSDGEPSYSNDKYSDAIKKNAEKNIGITIFNIGGSHDYETDLKNAVALGNGEYIYTDNKDTVGEVASKVVANFMVNEVEYEPYTPTIVDRFSSVVTGITQENMPRLGGFFGTQAKEKEGAHTVLNAGYVPLYTEWNYGEGHVGAFMCSLNGDSWSSEFLGNAAGKKLLFNMVVNNMPKKDIRPTDIEVTLRENNYTNTISVNTDLKDDEKLQIEVWPLTSGGDAENIDVNVTANYMRASFVTDKPGIYRVTVMKLKRENGQYVKQYDAQNPDELDTMKNLVFYKAFGYSEEYNEFSEFDGESYMNEIAEVGHGVSIEDVSDVYFGIETVVHKEYDPRWLFMILSIVLFLLDIAVRKFKFKWPHELIRDYKAKKRMNENS